MSLSRTPQQMAARMCKHFGLKTTGFGPTLECPLALELVSSGEKED